MLFKYSEALGHVEMQERGEIVRAAGGAKLELESWQRGVHLATITANGNDVDPPLGVSGSYRQARAAIHTPNRTTNSNKPPKTPRAAVCQWLLPPKQASRLTRKYGKSDQSPQVPMALVSPSQPLGPPNCSRPNPRLPSSNSCISNLLCPSLSARSALQTSSPQASSAGCLHFRYTHKHNIHTRW
jgi:hypothetical protein